VVLLPVDKYRTGLSAKRCLANLLRTTL